MLAVFCTDDEDMASDKRPSVEGTAATTRTKRRSKPSGLLTARLAHVDVGASSLAFSFLGLTSSPNRFPIGGEAAEV